jgi:hypothetical protein
VNTDFWLIISQFPRWEILQEQLLRRWGTRERLLERWTTQELWAPDGLFIQVNDELYAPARAAANVAREEFYDQKKAKATSRKTGAKTRLP